MYEPRCDYGLHKKCSILKETNSTYSDRTSDHPLLDENIRRIQQLEKENAYWKEMYLNETKYHQEVCVKIIERLESKLASIKTLNRQEVEKEYSFYLKSLIEISIDDNDKKDYKICLKKFITAICNLALPQIDKDKIVKALEDIYQWEGETDNEFHIRLSEIIKEINNV